MANSSRRWQVGAIVARVRASSAIGAAGIDTASRAALKLEVLRIADSVDAGLIGTEQAIAAFRRIVEQVTGGPSESIAGG
jgi:hypothetical protein